MDTEEKKLTSSEIDEMLKEAEEVHSQRRTVNKNRKTKKIRIDRIIAFIIIIALLAGAIVFAVNYFGNSEQGGSQTKIENPLQDEKYPEISDVIKNYLEAYLIQDDAKRIEILAQYVDNLGDMDEGGIAANKYVDSYSDIECYSKEGPYENTYVVYAYYHMNFKNISTSVPSITRFYVTRDSETGDVFIHNGVSNDEISEYMNRVTKDQDVQDLIAEVNKEYQQALDSDSTLKEFMNNFQNQMTQASSEQPSTAANQPTTAEAATTQPVTKAEQTTKK